MQDSAHAEQPTRARCVFLAYAAILSLILYLDRICIAESAGDIARELDLDDVQRGLMFSAFTVGYMLFEVPSGAWGDRYGAKRVLCRIVLCWSLFTVLTGCVHAFTLDSGLRFSLFGRDLALMFTGFLELLLLRFIFGAAEAGAYPNIARSSARWFPLEERGLAQGVVATAGRLGGGLSSAATIAVTVGVNAYLWPGMGWRVSFWLFGMLGLVWVGFFAWWFRNSPAEHPSVNAAELALIQGEKGRGGSPEIAKLKEGASHPAGVPWGILLTRTNLWAYSLMAFCSAFVVYLYFTRFPEYLADRHHLVRERWGWVAGLPMICGAAGCTLGGVLTDWLVRRTRSKRWGRRLMGLAGKGGGAVLLLIGASLNDPLWAVLWISLSAFTSDLALAAHWAIATDTGGRFVGTVFGVMNTVAAIGAAASPVLGGYFLWWLSPHIGREQAWNVVLYVFAGTLAVSALCWLRIDAEESMVGD